MKTLSGILSAAGLALALTLTGMPAGAQTSPPLREAPPAPPPLKDASPAAIAAANELLAMKNASAMYAQAIPNIVAQTKDALTRENLNYQKDLNEVAVIVAQKMAGREAEIGEGMAKIYATAFTEQELRTLLTFYQSPLGQKVLNVEPRLMDQAMSNAGAWGDNLSQEVIGSMRDEMKKRGHDM